MSASESTDRPLRDLGLWLGIVGAPLVWLAQFQTIYMQVYPACGTGRNVNIGLCCAGFFVVIALLGIYPLRNWSQNRVGQNPVNRTRRFMSILGVMSVGMSLLVVIAQWSAALLLDPCVI
jgi:hypothetical protein